MTLECRRRNINILTLKKKSNSNYKNLCNHNNNNLLLHKKIQFIIKNGNSYLNPIHLINKKVLILNYSSIKKGNLNKIPNP